MRIYSLFGASLIIFVALLISCSTPTPKDLSQENIIPKPVEVSPTGSSFRITENTEIIFAQESEEMEMISEYFVQLIKPATGFDLNVNFNKEAAGDCFYFEVSNGLPDIGDEGYILEITDELVKLTANNAKGIFNGIQTIRQLFPAEIESPTKSDLAWELASGKIVDYPLYSYRGAMLDVSRHFFGVDDVKKYIDYLARYKMNILHLHLSDDQGWRIEIKKWPKLTEIGGSTEVGGGSGGFYTQEQYADLVNYANERFITIIPEIDMPGHTNAALASYAELNCDDQARELYTGTEVGFSTFCTDKEIVYEFINDVVSEISALTTGPYFHVGGDESHSTAKEDYIYFINRVEDIVYSHGKQMIGWDEIATTELNENSIAQFWATKENAIEAVNQGVKVIMSPASRAYLDMKYDSTTELGLKWAGLIEVDHGYNWDPATMVPGLGQESILGIESPLWTETVTNIDELEYLVFPRLLGYAEIGWTPAENRNWDDYKARLGNQAKRFKILDINFYPSKQVDWQY